MCAPLLCGRASFCAPPMILSKFVLWACCRRHTTIETDSTCTLFSIHTYRFSNKTINKECNQKLDTWHGHVTQSHGKEVVTEARTVYGGLQKKNSCIALVLTQVDDTTQRPCSSTDWYCIFTRITRTKIEESTKPSYDDFRHPVTCWKSSAGYMQISACKVVSLQYRGDFFFLVFVRGVGYMEEEGLFARKYSNRTLSGIPS